MASEEKVKQWIDIANMDLALAEHTANTMWPIPLELVCFHCQQASDMFQNDDNNKEPSNA